MTGPFSVSVADWRTDEPEPKAGQTSLARIAYTNATLLPTYSAWPYRPMLVDRLATLDARAALYADHDPNNDPPLIGTTKDQRSSCHAQIMSHATQ